MNALCPVCRFPLRRTKRGGLVCGRSWWNNAKSDRAHRAAIWLASREAFNWNWTAQDYRGTTSNHV